MATNDELVKNILTRGVEEAINRAHLERALLLGKELRIKHGIDPTAPSLHIGHAVPLRKIRAFQGAGHIAVIIIGDYTAMIGDPSGKDKTRSSLSEKEVKQNAKNYKKQILKVLDKDKTEFHVQSEWYKKFKLADVVGLLSRVSASQLLSHETFRQRLEKEQAFMAHELIYPVLQGYDSVAVRADVEIGALEQKFNLLMGRTIQKQHDMTPQDVLMVPYLTGTDGKEKMSKSMGNTIDLADEPNDMYGKFMSIPDTLIHQYAELLTDINLSNLDAQTKTDPREAKVKLARTITAMFHGEKKAEEAAGEFDRVFQKREDPNAPTADLSEEDLAEMTPVELLTETGLVSSRSEARRLIEQGGVFIDGKRVESWQDSALLKGIKGGEVIRIGRRKAVKINLRK